MPSNHYASYFLHLFICPSNHILFTVWIQKIPINNNIYKEHIDLFMEFKRCLKNTITAVAFKFMEKKEY